MGAAGKPRPLGLLKNSCLSSFTWLHPVAPRLQEHGRPHSNACVSCKPSPAREGGRGASGLGAPQPGNLSHRGLRILDSFFLSQKQRGGRERLAGSDRQGLCSSLGLLSGGVGGGEAFFGGEGRCPQAHPSVAWGR